MQKTGKVPDGSAAERKRRRLKALSAGIRRTCTRLAGNIRHAGGGNGRSAAQYPGTAGTVTAFE